MALINCPDCDRKVSSNAVSCPGCGRSMAGSTAGSERTIELRFIMTLGNRIKYVRVDLRQDEFAEILGAKRNTVSAWECNLIKPGATYRSGLKCGNGGVPCLAYASSFSSSSGGITSA